MSQHVSDQELYNAAETAEQWHNTTTDQELYDAAEQAEKRSAETEKESSKRLRTEQVHVSWQCDREVYCVHNFWCIYHSV